MAATLFSVTAHVKPGMTGKARDYDIVSVGVYSSRERAAAAAELYAAKWCDPASGALVPRVSRDDRWTPAYANMQDAAVVSRFLLKDESGAEGGFCGALEVFVKELVLDAPPTSQHRGPASLAEAEGKVYYFRERTLRQEAAAAARAAAFAAGADAEAANIAAEAAEMIVRGLFYRPVHDAASREAALADMAAAGPAAAASAAAAAAAFPRIRARRAAVDAAAVAAAIAAGVDAAAAAAAAGDKYAPATSAFDAALRDCRQPEAPLELGHGHFGWWDQPDAGMEASIVRAEAAGMAVVAAAGARAAEAGP
jgi:hypothetical protein